MWPQVTAPHRGSLVEYRTPVFMISTFTYMFMWLSTTALTGRAYTEVEESLTTEVWIRENIASSRIEISRQSGHW